MIRKLLFLLSFIIYSSISFAQDNTITQSKEPEEAKGTIPFAVIENVPVYPGCKGNGNQELKKCMSDKISAFINIHFDMKKIISLDLPAAVYRTNVQFKIDKEGNIVNVYAKSSNPEIEKEAIRVVSNLPKMVPGKQKGEAVGVLYSLPIIFKIETSRKR